jgi:NAD(P)-dependent dehydrogenase (short-subunit alcohol dehydrogenase family)
VERDWSNLVGGRSAVVTGSGAGMGRAIAIMLARAGGEVWIADLDVERAERVVGEIEKDGGKAHAVVANVCDPESVAAMAERTGPVDIVVNNAGSGVRAFGGSGLRLTPFVETQPEEWEPILAVNLSGVMHVTHRYLPAMIERGWGRILTIVSDAGRRGERYQVVYGAAKAAAMGFSRGLAAEVGRAGVTVNCISLGSMKHGPASDLLEEDPDRERRQLRAYPVGRLGRVGDPAPLAVLLCSDAGEWITGQVYPVNGGYTSAL